MNGYNKKNENGHGALSVQTRLPRAAAAAILGSGLSAFIISFMLSENHGTAAIISVMLLCAVLTAAAELLGVSLPALSGGAAVCAAAGAAMLFVPQDGESLRHSIITGQDIRTTAVLVPCVLLSAAVCLAACALNRLFAARCVIAGGLLLMLGLFAWLRIELMKFPAVLITAYVIMILCQVCASGAFRKDGADRLHETWFVAFSLIIATLVFVFPYPKTRIKWDTWFHTAPTERMEYLGEMLDIDTLDEGGTGGKSGYSGDQSNLGGWLEFSNEARLRVIFADNDHSDRLVGAIYDSYTGKGWLTASPPEGTGYPIPAAVLAEEQSAYGFVSVYEMVDLEKEHRREQGERPTLFYPPGTYRIIDGSSGKYAYRDGRSMTFAEYPNENYEFSRSGYKAYYLKHPQTAVLTEKEMELYLSLPAELPERVGQLASDVTKGCGTNAEKADSIIRLLSGYEYETWVRPTPDNADFVDWFLFDTKKGYCEYYASAAAVLARCAGIPSRYIQGFLVPNADSEMATVTGRDAHAWAEFYIEGEGWVVYDPVTDSVYDDSASPTDLPAYPEPEQEHDRGALGRVLMYSYGAVAALALMLIAARPLLRRAAYRLRLSMKYRRRPGYGVLLGCSRLLWVLASCGMKRSDDETLSEFGKRVLAECDWLDTGAGEKMTRLLERTGEVLYAGESVFSRGADGGGSAARLVRSAYIRSKGLAAYIRGHRQANISLNRERHDR